MDILAVRTKLQAVIADSLLCSGVVSRPYRLVKLYAALEPGRAEEMGEQVLRLERDATTVTELARSTQGDAWVTIRFFFLFLSAWARGHRVFLANVSWIPIALALRLVPGARIYTFDDGTANILRLPHSYLSDLPSQRGGAIGMILRWLFPRGCSAFVRTRIVEHFTIFPDRENIVAKSQLRIVNVRWQDQITPAQQALMPARGRRILLGTVYSEVHRLKDPDKVADDLAVARRWAEIYLPHPRQPEDNAVPAELPRVPAEALVAHFAQQGPVTVAHFNSTAAFSFVDDPRVTLIDLCQHCADVLISTPGDECPPQRSAS